MLWNASFDLHKPASCEDLGGRGVRPCVDLRILVDRSIVEVFVAGGRVAALMA